MPTVERAERLIRCFVNADEPFVPSRYGSHEPLRSTFDASDLIFPARMLSERPRTLLLQRVRPRYDAFLTWMIDRDRPWLWNIDFAAAWLQPKLCGPLRLTEFLVAVCTEFPPVFAGCATSGDRSLKHTVRRPGEHIEGMILNPGEGLPGIYWLTFFGPDLVAFFGRKRLLALDVHRIFDRGDSGVGILLQESPIEGTPELRRERESAVVAALGAEYFFDLANAASAKPRLRMPIPRATDHT